MSIEEINTKFRKLYLLILALLFLSSCTIQKKLSLDSKLTSKGERFLALNGLSFAPDVSTFRSNKLQHDLSQYLKKEGRVEIRTGTGCGDFAYSFFFILSLGIIPGWCPATISVCYLDANDKCEISQSTKFSEEYSGWLVAPIALFPGWEMGTEDAEKYSKGVITSINAIADKIENNQN